MSNYHQNFNEYKAISHRMQPPFNMNEKLHFTAVISDQYPVTNYYTPFAPILSTKKKKKHECNPSNNLLSRHVFIFARKKVSYFIGQKKKNEEKPS